MYSVDLEIATESRFHFLTFLFGCRIFFPQRVLAVSTISKMRPSPCGHCCQPNLRIFDLCSSLFRNSNCSRFLPDTRRATGTVYFCFSTFLRILFLPRLLDFARHSNGWPHCLQWNKVFLSDDFLLVFYRTSLLSPHLWCLCEWTRMLKEKISSGWHFDVYITEANRLRSWTMKNK